MKGVYTDMNTVYTELFQKLLHEKRFAELSKAASILHPDRGDLVIEEYDGDAPRLFKRNVETYVLCPYKLDVVQESGISRAIETGEIFDDADRVENHADFLQKTIMPMNAMANHGCCEPKKMKIVISGVIGKIGPDGSVSLDTTDMDNGAACIKDLMGCRPGEIESTCDRHLGLTPHEHPMGHAHGPMEYDHTSLPLDVRRDIHDITKEIDELTDVSDLSEDELNFDDLEDVEWDDDDDDDDEDEYSDDENFEEAVTIMRQPKRLKSLGREVISYIPTQIMQVQDTHDQMVLAGYVSSQLEKVDFYLNCLDVDDGRYIVPHDKQYLLQMQKDLTDLLQRILRLNPIVKYDRIWKPGIGGVR